MQHEIPQSLQSTVRLLERSYPEGLSEDMLLPVLRLLYDELSDRHLALVASQVACLDPSIALNKVYEPRRWMCTIHAYKQQQSV